MQCKVTDCETPKNSKGFCKKHYDRMLKHGTTELLPRRFKKRRVEEDDFETPEYKTPVKFLRRITAAVRLANRLKIDCSMRVIKSFVGMDDGLYDAVEELLSDGKIFVSGGTPQRRLFALGGRAIRAEKSANTYNRAYPSAVRKFPKSL
jgi:hypothetical protein